MEGGAEPEQDSTELPSDTEEKHRDEAIKAAVCEVCGAAFETRRGLSSHARSHLRQMGVCVSESSGAPIALLYQLITERDGKLAYSFEPSPTSPSDPPEPKKSPKKALAKPKTGSVTKLKIKIGELVRRHKPPSSLDKTRPPALIPPPVSPLTLPPVSLLTLPPVSPLALPPVSPVVLSKPLSTLTEPDSLTKVGLHRCELCGACYETKKGLASHARTHLRHLGVDLDSSAPAIKVLHDLLQREAEPGDQNSEDILPGPVTTPPAKKKKTAQHGSEQKDPSCEYCGEKFKTTQSLASHARSHLRHLGVTDWRGSPGATLKELMASCGSINLTKPAQSTPPTPGPIVPPTSTLTEPPTPPPPLPLFPPAPDPAPVRVPKARKGSRLAVPRPKPEATEQNGSAETPKNKPAAPTNQSLNQSEANLIPANQIPATVVQEEVGVSEAVHCDYCSDVFDSRKALSCHARAHLRQLGVKWVQYASPIDTLQELMIREGRGQGSEDSGGVKSFTPSPVDFFREKTEVLDGATTASEATCELCGFDFENRKALASHARAHLRQLGEQWSSSQSPIDALSQWMSREPEKVAQLHLSYQQGALPHVRKRRSSAPVLSSDADSAHSAMSRPSIGRESKSSSQRKLSSHRPSPYTASDSAHSVRGFERRPPKLVPHTTARAEPLKRVSNAPSLVPPPPETSLVKLVGKIYSLRCRFCEQVFHGPLSVQEDWLIHLRHHILNPNPAPSLPSTDTPQLIGQVV